LETGAYANPAQAALALRRALAGDPGNRTFQLGLIELYRGLGRLEEARALAESVQAAEHPEGRRLLALVYAELGATGPLLDLARAGAEDLAALAGTHATAAGRWETGVALLGLALERDPGDFASGLTLGKALVHAHRLAEARDHLARLLARPWPEPSRARAGFLLAVALLLEGRLEEGLPWLENRFRMEGGPRLEPMPLQPWTGGELAGRTLLLESEQGFGDVFMLVRYVEILAGRGARVVLRPLVGTEGVLATCRGLDALVAGRSLLPADTLRAPLMSLPGLCGTRLETIPARVPYLRVPDEVPHRAGIDACLAAAGPGRRIALVWAGNPAHNQDQDRSMPPELLETFAGLPGIVWFDLQVQAGPRPDLPLADLARHLGDFSDTAYALSQMDLLISVDSSPVHLAGALGRPVWLLLARLPDWRWMLERRDSPWYPTVELWRQPTRGDWLPVLAEMRERLLTLGQ